MAVARAAGYRACKRCDPDSLVIEVSPGPVSFEVALPYRGRRDIGATLAFLGARAVPGLESNDDHRFTRTLRLARGAGRVEIEPGRGRVACRVWVEHPGDAAEVPAKARSLLDLDRDLAAVERDLAEDGELARVMRGRRGRGVPGAVDGFEMAVRAVLGQQVSVAGARTLTGRLVDRFGRRLASNGSLDHGPDRLFPDPVDLAEADAAAIGMPAARAAAIRGLACAVAEGDLDLSPGAGADEVRSRLVSLSGLGPWTASYVTMRVQHDPDVFLAGDLGVRKAMSRFGVADEPSAIQARSEPWRPWRAYAVQYLWAGLGAASG